MPFHRTIQNAIAISPQPYFVWLSSSPRQPSCLTIQSHTILLPIAQSSSWCNSQGVQNKWSLTTIFADVLLNHVVDTYRTAIETEQEIMQDNPLDRMV